MFRCIERHTWRMNSFHVGLALSKTAVSLRPFMGLKRLHFEKQKGMESASKKDVSSYIWGRFYCCFSSMENFWMLWIVLKGWILHHCCFKLSFGSSNQVNGSESPAKSFMPSLNGSPQAQKSLDINKVKLHLCFISPQPRIVQMTQLCMGAGVKSTKPTIFIGKPQIIGINRPNSGHLLTAHL